jgi:uncharacterized protein YdaU (DUF1376 family)
MALRDQPYLPLYIQDYLTDEKLNECSASTQGVYIKIMCVLHKSDEYGKFLLKQNDKQDSKQTKNFALKFAKHITFTPEIIESAIDELIENKVMSINGDILYQKRMVKDNEISLKRSESGKKGGEKTQFASKFAKAKTKANSENEIENENVIKRNINNEQIYPDWIPKNTFLEYQNQRKKKIKPQSLNRFFNSLKKICDETKASPEEILNQSIVNGWEGIFPLKENKNANTSFRTNSYRGNNNDRKLTPGAEEELERIAESLRAKQ